MVFTGHIWHSNVAGRYAARLFGATADLSGNRIDWNRTLPGGLASLKTKDGGLILLEIVCSSSHQVIDPVDQVPVFAIGTILYTPPQFQEACSYICNLF